MFQIVEVFLYFHMQLIIIITIIIIIKEYLDT